MNYFQLCVNSRLFSLLLSVALFLLQVVSSYTGAHQHPAEKSRKTLSKSSDISFSPLFLSLSFSLFLPPSPSPSPFTLSLLLLSLSAGLLSLCTFSYPVFFPANSIHCVFSISYLCLLVSGGPQTHCTVAWIHSDGSKLGKSHGSPCSFPISQRSLFCAICCSMSKSCPIYLDWSFSCLRMENKSRPGYLSWLEAKIQLFRF